jgi:hypothetical protein
VVPSEPLAHLLHGFVEDWKRQRPTTSGQFAAGNRRTQERETLSAVEYLALETRRTAQRHDPAAQGVLPSTIENLLARDPAGRPRPRSRVTELRVADALVAAVGRTEAMYDGTLPVQPNPNASRAAQACCSGSLTG